MHNKYESRPQKRVFTYRMNVNLKRIFTEIYKKDFWTNGSGPGSLPQNVVPYLNFLKKLIIEKQINNQALEVKIRLYETERNYVEYPA